MKSIARGSCKHYVAMKAKVALVEAGGRCAVCYTCYTSGFLMMIYGLFYIVCKKKICHVLCIKKLR